MYSLTLTRLEFSGKKGIYRHTLAEGEELGGVGDRRVRRVQEHLVDGLTADVGGDDDDGAVARPVLAEGLDEFREVQGHGRRQGVRFDVLENDLHFKAKVIFKRVSIKVMPESQTEFIFMKLKIAPIFLVSKGILQLNHVRRIRKFYLLEV